MVISRLAAAQALLGLEVHVMCYGVGPDASGKDPNPEIDQKLAVIPGWDRVRQHRLPPPTKLEWYTASRASTSLREIIPTIDIVHVHGVWDPILREAAAAARSSGVPYVVAPHGMLDPWALSEKALKKKVALALGYHTMVHGASLMHALSRYEGECIAKFGYRGPIETISNGVFLEEIDPLPAKGSFRALRPTLQGRRFICFLSRLHPVKGLDLLADAFHSLASKHSDVDLVVVGPDFGAQADFEAQLERLGIRDRVHIIGPLWGRERFKPIVDAECFCLPSEHEAFSVAICEAMACGTPVVITENCSLPEAAEEGAGLVIKRNTTDLATALDQVLSNPAQASVMGARARELVVSRFTWQKVAETAARAYESIRRTGKKSLAIIANAQTPYRLATHQRLVRELRDLHLWSVYTHSVADQAWDYQAEKEINPVSFGPGEDCLIADKPRAWPHELAKGGEIMRFLKRERVSAVIVSGYNDPGRLRVLFSCWLAGIPVFLAGDSNIRGDRSRGFRRIAKNIVVRSVLQMTRGVLPFGANGADYFTSYGARKDRVWYFPAEPDHEIFGHADTGMVEQVREQFKFAPDRRRIVFCGRLARVKRVDIVIDAFLAVMAQRPEWDLVIVGNGPLKDELQARVPKSAAHRVTWAGFISDARKISAIYHSCDTFMLASEFEPWAVVVNEAADSGLALCVSDVVGAARELVADGENGSTFDPSNLQAATDALLKATDGSRLAAMKEASLRVSAEWRAKGDPVAGVRAALGSAGIMLAEPVRARTSA